MNSKLKADYIELINAELDGIQFLSVADIQDFVVFVKYTSTPLDLPRLHLIKELYDNECLYVCHPDADTQAQLLVEFQELIIARLSAMTTELDLMTTPQLNALINEQAARNAQKQQTRVEITSRIPSELTPLQLQTIHQLNAAYEYAQLIGYTIKKEEAPLCIDAATILLHLNRLTNENNNLSSKDRQSALIRALGAYYTLMDKYLEYDIKSSRQMLGKDKIADVKQVLINILELFGSSNLRLDQLNSFNKFLKKYLLINSNVARDLDRLIDTATNNQYFNTMYMSDTLSGIIADPDSQSPVYKNILKNGIVRYFRYNIGIRLDIWNFNENLAQQHLQAVVEVFRNILTKYNLPFAITAQNETEKDTTIFKKYGLNKLSLISSNIEVLDALKIDNQAQLESLLALDVDTLSDMLKTTKSLDADKIAFVSMDSDRLERFISLATSKDLDNSMLKDLSQHEFAGLIINPSRRRRMTA